jgi:hypothetical protein
MRSRPGGTARWLWDCSWLARRMGAQHCAEKGRAETRKRGRKGDRYTAPPSSPFPPTSVLILIYTHTMSWLTLAAKLATLAMPAAAATTYVGCVMMHAMAPDLTMTSDFGPLDWCRVRTVLQSGCRAGCRGRCGASYGCRRRTGKQDPSRRVVVS